MVSRCLAHLDHIPLYRSVSYEALVRLLLLKGGDVLARSVGTEVNPEP